MTHDRSIPAPSTPQPARPDQEADSPAARPPEALIAGGPPAPRPPDGQPADQVTLVRWLGAHLYTDGWDARACAAYLAAHGWARLSDEHVGRHAGRRPPAPPR